MKESGIKKAVVAYSGGLDTSVSVPWLREHYGCEVVCFTADIGQGEELSGLEEKALSSGATKLVRADLREEFATDYLIPMLQSGAIYEHNYLLGTAIARPLTAKWQVTVEEQESVDALRTNLVLSPDVGELHVLAVTSAANNEGDDFIRSSRHGWMPFWMPIRKPSSLR